MTRSIGEQSDTKLAVMLVMMWNRVGIPGLYNECVYHAKNSCEATKPRVFSSGNRTKLKLMGAILLFR